MGTYILFKAESAAAEGWEARQLSESGALTDILAEHYDASGKELPEVGYRLREYHRIEAFVNPEFPEASTHSRVGDWEVSQVEVYSPERPIGHFEAIVVCFCQYVPVTSALEPLSEIAVGGEHGEQEAEATVSLGIIS